jgi:hypothetical protein
LYKANGSGMREQAAWLWGRGRRVLAASCRG